MAKAGRYTTGRVMADARHAIVRKGDAICRKGPWWRTDEQGNFYILWRGPDAKAHGLRPFIEQMDERAAKRKGGAVKSR